MIKNNPSGFWKLDEVSGQTAYDSSGCGNHGSYIGGIAKNGMPLVSGGEHSTKITDLNYLEFTISKDFSGLAGLGGFGTESTSDNDFSLEIWFHPKTITSETPVFADDSGIGIYWDNGNILFRLENEEIRYSVPNPNRSMHVVAIYNVKTMLLYLNGEVVSSKAISKINFTNQALSFNCGPALQDEYFVIDAPAIYRYALNKSLVVDHYNSFFTNTESNIVLPDLGELFKVSEKYQNIANTFVFPAQVDWQYHANKDLLYKESNNSLYLNPDSTYGEFTKVISLPHWKNYISSKIEWFASKGVKVYVSENGEPGTWTECTNQKALPGFEQKINSLNNKVIYIKCTFESSNANIYVPELYYIKIHFYDDRTVWSHNGGSKISTIQPNSGNSWEISPSNNNSNILLRHPDNGIKTSESAFFVDTPKDIKFLEFIFSPKSLSEGYIFYNKTGLTESYISWSQSGVVSKNNIEGLYINGQDLSAVSNISNYLYIDDPNYILIKMSSVISGKIWLNGKQDAGIRSGVLDDNFYQNIAIYESADVNHLLHYNLYVGKDSIEAIGSGIQLVEESAKTYSRDKILINNI